MSVQFLVVIPQDPHADLPASSEQVRDALASMSATTEAKVKDYGKLQFIDAGSNFETVHCPGCAAEIGMSAWQDWMEADWHGEEGFHLHKHQTPCCGTNTTLNDLRYDQPQGFAHWMISARNEERGPLSSDELAQLETIAGMALAAIAQRY